MRVKDTVERRGKRRKIEDNEDDVIVEKEVTRVGR